MAQKSNEPQLLWQPSDESMKQSNIVKYMKWLQDHKNLTYMQYEDLWKWSVTEIEEFWETIKEYFDIQFSAPCLNVLPQRTMPGANWFEGAKLNYVQHVFRNRVDHHTAIIAKSEMRELQNISWEELYLNVATFAAGLKEAGIKVEDRIVGYLPNIPEAVVAFLACASMGAIWSSCSPDFGSPTVIDRFKQIEPKILIAVDGYRYGGKDFDKISNVQEIQKSLPTLERTIILPYLNQQPNSNTLKNVENWHEFMNKNKNPILHFEQVSFQHPLWVLFSSGTTGLPKAIVQGHGGILLEHLKQCSFHMNLKDDDRLFWHTTTGWMMWNIVVSGLLTGAAIILYDGNPGYPNLENLWCFAEETEMTYFGTSASFLLSCLKEGVEPAKNYDLSKLKGIGSTGSPLPLEGFHWVYQHVKKDLWLSSLSGGTDVCSAFVGGVPILPVYSGMIQCRTLGAKVEAYDEGGTSLTEEVGELVVLEPMPSMPLYFWNDHNEERYKRSYFDVYPDIWRHGDWIKISIKGSCQIYGRSDSTINRGGIRMGTSEIYSAVESIEGISDSLAIDISNDKGDSFLLLFIVLKEGIELSEKIHQDIKQRIIHCCSPRHVPDVIYKITDVPRTLNGKKLEIPVKKILMGEPIEKAVKPGSLNNPDTLQFFIQLQKKFHKT